MKLIRHILFAAILPLIALVLAAVFSPVGPPTAEAAGAELTPIVCETIPAQPETLAGRAADWLHAIVSSTRDLIS